VATQSLSSSVAQLSKGIVGDATLQLLARDPHGFEAGLLARVRAIPGVKAAAPLLEATAQASGPKGHESAELVGADSSLAGLGGALVKHTALSPFANIDAIALPSPLARKLGVTKFGDEAIFQVYGSVAEAPLYEQLHQAQIGPLVSSPIAVTSLASAQEMTGLGAHVSRILVEPKPGREATVRAALVRLAGSHLNVEPTSYDETLFEKASSATDQSTTLFALISALVGFLFAFNAMLLTVPQRRRLIAELRRDGYPPSSAIAVLMLDALVLGLLACALGLALGEELSIHLFKSNPGYLSSAFAVGNQRVVGWQAFAVAIGGGILAACVAVLSPLREILSRRPPPVLAPGELTGPGGGAAGGSGGAPSAQAWLTLAGLACLGGAVAILEAAPKLAVLGMVFLVAALLLLLPLSLAGALALVRRIAPSIVSAVPHVATMELRAGRTRALAISATGAIAVFGAVSIQAAHGDLLHGLENAAHDMNAAADVWVSPAGSYNLLQTAPFQPSAQTRLGRLPGVRSVGLYRGGLLDWGDRRIWAIAPPRSSEPLLPASQIVAGDLRQAEARVRAGGWVAISRAIAEEHDLHVGSSFILQAPDPVLVRVAALTTNIGWAPGAIVMNADDYARAWASPDASAYDVLLDPGFPAAVAGKEIAAALGPRSGLATETAVQHADRQNTLSRQGLARLTQIATLILIVAILAMAAAMANMVWQRRPRLAKLKLEGFPAGELWRTILLESIILVGVGCFGGALFGLLGQQLLDRALANVIGFPVVASLGALPALAGFALVTLASVLVVALPGYLATGVAPAVALQD
ncbi:MAG TPA: FtsX-like permease family protein, partial [Solirubrobacteraceae bacterium]|nr:FtsX-like permease family protein [Solirubrobacteraceae bacterium]